MAQVATEWVERNTQSSAGGPEFFLKAPTIHVSAILHFISSAAFNSVGAAYVAGASVEKLGATVDKRRAAEIGAAAPPLLAAPAAWVVGPAVEIGGRTVLIAAAFK